MRDAISRAVESLGSLGVRLSPGLSDAELAGVERRFGFSFAASHRRFLSCALPLNRVGVDEGWPDWRAGCQHRLDEWLSLPVDGVVFDVHNNGFWPASWGHRPPESEQAERLARRHLARVPRVIPIYGHRFVPAAPTAEDPPVFSVHQTDVIYYGNSMVDYLAHEFGIGAMGPRPARDGRTTFWSDLAENDENSEM